MHANEALITKFYESFQQRDGEAMAACYHPQVQFSDPVFTDLKGVEAGAMWRMLTDRAEDLQVTFSDVQADDENGSAKWEAIYTFGKTKRKVHNKIRAEFAFQDGQIIRHTDRFSLWRWSRQALGMRGLFLGWTPIVANAIREESAKGLQMYMRRKRIQPAG